MSIQVTCDSCFYDFTVADRNAGKRGKCPECAAAIMVPAGAGRRSRSSGSKRSSAGGRRAETASRQSESQQKKLLIGGGIAGGLVIIVLIGVVAYLAGKSGGDGDRASAIAANDGRSAESPTAPQSPKAADPTPTAGPTLVETSTTPTPATGNSPSNSSTPKSSQPKPDSSTNERFASVADLIEAVEPSVCRIDVESAKGSSTGSGFVVDASGIIATNYHVIEGALRASVTFPDKSTAKIKGFLHLDPKKDIALVVIEPPASSLTVAKLATGLPRKGEILVAIGAPLGLDFSASEGKVAAIRSQEDLQKFGADKRGTWIQSTAPISPGNSGGPLFNMDGEVVAANTMTITIGQNLNFGISAGDISQAIEKKSDQLIALSPAAIPVAAKSSGRGGRGKPIDGTKTTRGRDLLAGLSEVELLVGTFSFDPTGKVEKYVVRLAENTLKQANLEQKHTNAALMVVFMKFDTSGSRGRAKALAIESQIIVHDKNEFVMVWKDKEGVGSFSESSFIKGDIPLAVRTKVVKFFKGFRSARKKAINERNKASK